MTLTLVIAIAFTIAALGSIAVRRGRNWWLLTLLLTIAAVVNWLRWSDLI